MHAATTLGNLPNPYANYDAMGNMTCRNIDTTSAHTCTSGSANAASMTYDAEGRMDSWTAPSGTTASDNFLYDNEGKRVLQRTSTTVGSTTTVTDDITFGGYTEVTISGGTTATSKYYSANGQRVAMRVNGILSYLLSDMLGSSTVALNSDGSGRAVQLFSPYGSVRYSWGTMPTNYNFTGQRLDSQTGLLYYIFRYYDPVSGRFLRADTMQNNANGMDPYAYVKGNPETKNDPTGHKDCAGCGDWEKHQGDPNMLRDTLLVIVLPIAVIPLIVLAPELLGIGGTAAAEDATIGGIQMSALSTTQRALFAAAFAMYQSVINLVVSGGVSIIGVLATLISSFVYYGISSSGTVLRTVLAVVFSGAISAGVFAYNRTQPPPWGTKQQQQSTATGQQSSRVTTISLPSYTNQGVAIGNQNNWWGWGSQDKFNVITAYYAGCSVTCYKNAPRVHGPW